MVTDREQRLKGPFRIRGVIASRERAFVICASVLHRPIADISLADVIFVHRISDGKRLWLFDPGDLLGTTITWSAGKLYAASTGHVRMLDCRTGAMIWEMKPIKTRGRNLSDIVVDQRRIYVCLWGGEVLCLDKQTGKEVWRQDIELDRDEKPRLTLCGEVLFVTAQTTPVIRALGVKQGRQLWQAELPDLPKLSPEGGLGIDAKVAPAFRPPACLSSGLLLVGVWAGIGDTRSYLAPYDMRNGRRRWQSEVTKSGMALGLAVDGNRAYASLGSGDVVCLQMLSGRRIWRTSLVAPNDVDPARGYAYPFVLPGALSGKTLVVANRAGTMFGLSTESGNRLWSYTFKNPMGFDDGIVIAGGHILVTNSNKLWAFKPQPNGPATSVGGTASSREGTEK
ncbi:MAG TPA: PQQ-binding-like beta-propeller repeat protein [Phycisphaerae bacterium]|nr:PQQ-binding-like beta-propeller repeat protein [Phycisphaerae bacterium]